MKNIKISLSIALLLGNLSCGKDFGVINIDPNNPGKVPAEYLLSSAEKFIADQNSGLVYVFFGGMWGQYFAQNNYTEVSRYRGNPGNWNYAEGLFDLLEVQRIVLANPGLDAAVDKNKIAIAKIFGDMLLQDMTDIYGPIPYTEAMQGELNRTPKYDTQKDIYIGLLSDLKDALGQMDETKGSFGSADLIYSGDVEKWKKFGNSLRLRIAMRMADVEPVAAKAEVEAFFADAFSSIEDNAYFPFQIGQPNNNKMNQDRLLRIDADYCMSNILIDKTLRPLNDPRLPAYADETQNSGGYAGRPFGQESNVAASEPPSLYSQPSGAGVIRNGGANFRPYDVLAPDAPARFMSFAEVCFIGAEAIERGWNVPGTAAEWYEKGITASLEEWGITDPDVIATYLAQPNVAYATASGDWKQKIGVQKWIALYMQGTQGWSEWRRLDFQKLELPVGGVLTNVGNKVAPVRTVYPAEEQTLNSANYQAALGLLGGADKFTTQVWWDVQ